MFAVRYACKKASTAISALFRMISNSSADYCSKRDLLVNGTLSEPRCGRPEWARALGVWESAYQLICIPSSRCLVQLSWSNNFDTNLWQVYYLGYRMVSHDENSVIARILSIGIFIKNDVRCLICVTREPGHWPRLSSNDSGLSATKGKCVHRLIPVIFGWPD